MCNRNCDNYSNNNIENDIDYNYHCNRGEYRNERNYENNNVGYEHNCDNNNQYDSGYNNGRTRAYFNGFICIPNNNNNNNSCCCRRRCIRRRFCGEIEI